MPEHLITRHPFPGPGLAVRILGDITPEKVRILQEADDIFIQGLRDWGLYDQVWQAGVIPVSYTHLDVYKRQPLTYVFSFTPQTNIGVSSLEGADITTYFAPASI